MLLRYRCQHLIPFLDKRVLEFYWKRRKKLKAAHCFPLNVNISITLKFTVQYSIRRKMASFDTTSKKQIETNPQDFVHLCFGFEATDITVLEIITPE